MHILMAQMAAVKHLIWNEETESRNGVRNPIAMTEKYYIKIPWHWNVQNISTPISETMDVYHKDKPVQK